MPPDDAVERLPTGIDLGSERTVVAVSDGERTGVLGDDEPVGVPSRLAITEAGVAVGAAAVATDATPVRLLPHERSAVANESAMAEGAGLLPLQEFLARVLAGSDGGRDHDGDRPAAGSDHETLPAEGDGTGGDAAVPTVLTVPGAYTRKDATLVEQAALAAGVEEPTVVRSPLGVAANELLGDGLDGPRHVVVADVGAEWCDLALVAADADGTVDVLARESLADHGRRSFDAHLAEWAVGEVAAEHGVELEVTPDGMAPLTEAANEALEAVDADEPAHLTAELSDGVEVVEGGWLGAETVTVDLEVDLYACYDALEEPIRELQDRLAALLEAAGAAVETVDAAVVAGDGAVPTPITHGFEDYLGRATTPPTGATPYTASARGAAQLAASLARGESPVGTETLDRTVEVRLLGPDGPEYREVASFLTRADEDASIQVQTTADGGDGYLEVWYRDDHRGERERVASVAVSGLPRRESVGVPVEVTLAFDDHWLSADRPPSVTASLADGSDPEDRHVTASVGASGSASWFAGVDYEAAALDGGRPEAGRASAVTVRSPEQAALAGVSDEGVAKVAHRIRNKLWERGVKNEAGIEADELAILVRELDSRLAGEGIESIEPSPGEEFDSARHEIATTRTADEGEGTILEVEAPGMVVDGHVMRPARVVVAG